MILAADIPAAVSTTRRVPATASLAATPAGAIALRAVEIQVAATLPRALATARPAGTPAAAITLPAAGIPVAEVTTVAVATPAARVAAVAADHAVAEVVVHTGVVEEAVAVTIANCDLTLAPHPCPFSRLWRIKRLG